MINLKDMINPAFAFGNKNLKEFRSGKPLSGKPEVGDYLRDGKVLFGKIISVKGREISVEPISGQFGKAVASVQYDIKKLGMSFRNKNMERNVGRPIWTPDKKYWKKK